eukprot:6207733-Pleurochrysis_carterae.AAC.2
MSRRDLASTARMQVSSDLRARAVASTESTQLLTCSCSAPAYEANGRKDTRKAQKGEARRATKYLSWGRQVGPKANICDAAKSKVTACTDIVEEKN